MKPIVHHLTVGFPFNKAMETLCQSAMTAGFHSQFFPKFWKENRIKKIEKFVILQNFLRTGSISDNELILVTDAYDVLILDHACTVINKFKQFDCDILFNGETTFFPSKGREDLRAFFDQFTSSWKYLNSGCYIGYAWAITNLIDWCLERSDILAQDSTLDQNIAQDDQALAQDYFVAHYNRGPVRVQIDLRCQIFGSLNTVHKSFKLNDGLVYLDDFHTQTSILHCNGDKENIKILHLLWRLFSECGNSIPNLRCLKNGRYFQRYEAQTGRLEDLENPSEDTVFAIFDSKGEGVIFNARFGALALNPDGQSLSVLGDDEFAEVSYLRRQQVALSMPRSENLAISPNISLILDPVPLSFFREPYSVYLVDKVVKYGRSIATNHCYIRNQSI